MGNGNSTSSRSNKVHAHTAKVGSNEPQYVPSRQRGPSTKAEMVGLRYGTKVGSFRGEHIDDKPKVETFGVYSEQHGNHTSLDSDDTFNDYIQRAKQKIRTVSNVGREHGNYPAPPAAAAPEYYVANNGTNNNNNNNNENQSDQFSEFIQLAKKKLRTTSRDHER